MARPYAEQVQQDPNRCLVCGLPAGHGAPLVAVLKEPLRRNSWHWLHAGSCHDQHSARCKAERAEQRA